MELRSFDLVAANPLLIRSVPLSFKSGKLDLYSEVISEKGAVRGYVKPFFKDMSVLGNKSDFKGVKHFAIEILTALSDAILRKSDDKTVAMIVPFKTVDGKIQVDTPSALSSAIGHGFGDPVAPVIDDKFDIN